MVERKRKKVTKYRGSKTHGGGSMKKRRGAGHRGGRGNAGSGKKGDGKKPSYWGKKADKGFAGHITKNVTMNVGHLNSSIVALVAAQKASEKSGAYAIEMNDVKIDKLLGSGIVTHKLNVSCDFATPKAIEKIEKAGGKVTARYAIGDEFEDSADEDSAEVAQAAE